MEKGRRDGEASRDERVPFLFYVYKIVFYEIKRIMVSGLIYIRKKLRRVERFSRLSCELVKFSKFGSKSRSNPATTEGVLSPTAA